MKTKLQVMERESVKKKEKQKEAHAKLEKQQVKDREKLLKAQQRKEVCLFACFVALRPKSTAMVMAGQSVHLTTLFSWACLNRQLTSTSCTYFCL